jgi:hypothetical protein
MKNDIDLSACVGLDSETCLIRSALGAPPVVCTAFFWPESGPAMYATQDQWAQILALFEDERRLIVLHNGAFDVCCYLEWVPSCMRDRLRRAIFRAYEQNRVLDTMLAQRLVEIETGDVRGKLGLDGLCARYGLHVEKHETEDDGREVRLSYGRYLNRPLSEYSPKAIAYAKGDPQVTWKLLERILSRGLVSRAALGKMCRTDLALKLVATFGLKTDPARVDKLEAQAKERIQTLQAIMLENGFPVTDDQGAPVLDAAGEQKITPFMRWERGKPQPVRSMAAIKRAAAAAYNIPVDAKGLYCGDPDLVAGLQAQGLLTDGGKTGRVSMSTAKLVLEESGDPLLISLGEAGEWAAVWNKDLKVFRLAATTGLPISTKFGFAATTRTTSGGKGMLLGMNEQNLRKKEGIRECFVSRWGALVATDYTGLENGTLAQAIVWGLGRRTMADKINAGWNFHAEVGSLIMAEGGGPLLDMQTFLDLKESGDPMATECYGAAKPLNFGLPGFMKKASTVQSYARIGYKVNRPVAFWQKMIDLWYRTQHDQVAYLEQYVESFKVGDGHGSLYNIPIPGTDIIRRGATRTAAANTGFQGLGAQVAGEGLYLVCKAQILGDMPGRACAFIHDEIITDCAKEDVDAVRFHQERLMLAAAESIMPDVKMKAGTVAMAHWSKNAKARYDAAGRLQIDDRH